MAQEPSDNFVPSQQQAAGNLEINGNENATAFGNAGRDVKIDQSSIIYNYFYYREESLAATVEPTTPSDDLPCPYRGLLHFRPDDEKFFFGRSVFVNGLVEAVQTRAFIPILGASGSGKSSVVFAGLVPKLQQAGHWRFTYFRPGEQNDPFYALSRALVPLYRPEQDATDQMTQVRKLATRLRTKEILLADVIDKIQQGDRNQRVLLIADQFEELYTLCPEEPIRRSFLDCLLASLATAQASSPLVLVATMRADFLGNALSYRPLADVLQDGDVKLGAMNWDELCEVIEKPAAKLGVTFEAGLVERILQDVQFEPGNLPLLEFALTELWERRRDRQLTHEAYTAIGEVQGSLSRHADASYQQLSPAEQALARQLMMELVQLGNEEQEVTRRRAGWEQLQAIAESPKQLQEVVGKLVNQRLIVTDEKTVEVAHEALLTEWPLLKQLIQENRQVIRLRNQLTNVCQEWLEQKRSTDFLLSPRRLAAFEDWIKRDQPRLPPLEMEYLQQCRNKRDRELRFYWQTTMGAIAAALCIGIISVIGAGYWRTADRERIRAQTNFARASFTVNRDTLDALLEALKAGKQLQQSFWLRNDSELRAEVMEGLLQTTNWVKEYNRLNVNNSLFRAVSFSPDGQTFATGGDDGALRLWSKDGENKLTLQDHKKRLAGISFSKDGKFLATCSTDGTIKVRDPRTGQVKKTWEGNVPLRRTRFSPDGTTVAAVSSKGHVILWNWQTNRSPQVLQAHSNKASDLDFSRDGKTFATVGDEAVIRLWTRQGKPKGQPLSGHKQEVTTVRFNPTGNSLASGSRDGTVILWNWQARTEEKNWKAHSQGISDIQFSQDGQQLATAGDDGIINLWNRSGAFVTSLKKHQEQVTNVSFSPDGKSLASASLDSTVKLWHIHPNITVLNRYEAGVDVVVFKQPDGQLIVTNGENNSIKLWQSDGTFNWSRKESNSVYSIDFSPTEDKFVTTSGNNINLWSTQGKPLKTLGQHKEAVHGVAFSPNGKIVASGGGDQVAKLWDLSERRLIRSLKHSSPVNSVRFSPNNQTIATADEKGTIRLWSTQGEDHNTLEFGSAVYRVNFSPDSQEIVVGGESSTGKLWKLDGKALPSLAGHTKSINDVSYSPNGGQFIATASDDGTIKLWTRDSKLFTTLLRQDAPVRAISFSPDNQKLAVASGDKKVLILDITNLTVEGLIQRGCDQVQHYETAKQLCQK